MSWRGLFENLYALKGLLGGITSSPFCPIDIAVVDIDKMFNLLIVPEAMVPEAQGRHFESLFGLKGLLCWVLLNLPPSIDFAVFDFEKMYKLCEFHNVSFDPVTLYIYNWFAM